jgi:hypothetical protein
MTLQAEVQRPHPAYLHALSDLRTARHYLNDGWAWAPVGRDDNAAIHQIDGAIAEIKKASIDDGKGLNDPFLIDTRVSPHDRFRKANELLWSAHTDLSRADDVPQARGPRDWECRSRSPDGRYCGTDCTLGVGMLHEIAKPRLDAGALLYGCVTLRRWLLLQQPWSGPRSSQQRRP